MKFLIIVTLIWAFSFSLIGEFLAGRIDSYFAVLIRVAIAAAIFVPFTNFRIDNSIKLKIMGIGIIQIGFMYILFYKSFLFLSVPEVILFTIFTPIYITLMHDIIHQRFTPLYLISASLAVVGAFIIRYNGINSGFVTGFLMVQGANICFALGQVAYKYLMEQKSMRDVKQLSVFGYFHFGALIVSIIAFMLFGNMDKISPDTTQWMALVWLGVVASGLGYFLWNKGAVEVDSGILAIMNNALVPAGLLVNLFLWNKDINITALIIGGTVIASSLYVHRIIMDRVTKPIQ
ncbi:MAG TPA: DMT family transporter [Sulfurovum sp.]|nr:DMT family transporter [Sulfurovum sp.]